jgi:hypothetical protein
VARQRLDRDHDRRLPVLAVQLDVQPEQIKMQRPEHEPQHLADALMVGGTDTRARGHHPQRPAVEAAVHRGGDPRQANSGTVTSRIDALRDDEPWPGYDELGVDEVRAVLSEGDEQRVKDVRAYERNHKARAGVIQATESELSNA